MLRVAAITGLRAQRCTASKSLQHAPLNRLLMPRNPRTTTSTTLWRALSSQGKQQEPPKNKGGEKEEEMTQEIVLTPGEKVVAGTRLTIWAGAAVLASVCAYYIGKELIPTYVVLYYTMLFRA